MKKRYFIWLFVALFFILSFTFDKGISKFIEDIRNPVMDYLLLGISFGSSLTIILLFLTTLFFYSERKRRWILPLWLTILLTMIIGFLLKIIIKRNRPFEEGVVSVANVLFYEIIYNFNTWNFSFPSLQSMLAFSVLPFISKEFKKFKHVWVLFAFLVAFSRVYFGIHYMSDIIFGAILGYFIGYLVLIIEEKYEFGMKFMQKMKLMRK